MLGLVVRVASHFESCPPRFVWRAAGDPEGCRFEFAVAGPNFKLVRRAHPPTILNSLRMRV